MAQIIAQATNSYTGASNAADFQPGTRNPQTQAGASLFPQTKDGSLQTGSQEQLLEGNQARISVPSNPAPAGSQTVQPKANNAIPLIAVMVAVVIVAALLLRRRRTVPDQPATVETPEPAKEVITTPVVKKAPVKPIKKKPVPKKSKSQRKKRARR